jgi:hypothetical protein
VRATNHHGPRVCVAIGATLGLAVYVFGPPGVDAPAHLFQTWLFAHHGYQIWNNYWYAGRYQYVTYSLLYYPLASVTGQAALAAAGCGLLAGSFATLSNYQWGAPARAPALLFATTAPLVLVISGMYPFLAAAAAAMFALVALQRGQRLIGLGTSAVAAALSPLAFLLLGVVLAAALAAHGDHRRVFATRRWLIAGFAGLIAAGIVWERVFSSPQYYAYSLSDLPIVAAFSLTGVCLTRHRPRRDLLRLLFVTYLATNLVFFAIPSPVGSNAVRLFSIAGAPLIWLAAQLTPRRRAPTIAAIVAATLTLQLAPFAADAYTSAQDAAATPTFWHTPLAFLTHHHDAQYRVEVVATWGHWEAYYLAKRGIPLARGWYRQDDYPQNHVLYDAEDLNSKSYRAWLRSLGVKYVLLPHTQLDYSAQREAKLLRSATSGLTIVLDTPTWTIYQLPHPTPIMTTTHGPDGTILHLDAASIEINIPQPGTYTLRVSYSPYWTATTPTTCLAQNSAGMISLHAHSPGPTWLRLQPTIEAVTSQLAGQTATGC